MVQKSNLFIPDWKKPAEIISLPETMTHSVGNEHREDHTS
jgi:hypothetical protein